MDENIDKYKKLTDIEHVLLRPSMYIGSMKIKNSYSWIHEGNKFIKRKINYVPGFIKLFDEIIMNSIDESKRESSKLNIIKVNINDNIISVFDNGGIPVVKNKEKEWIPEMVFSNMRAGSNFSDEEDRIWAGTNGVGSSCVNVFSKQFELTTSDGKKKFYQKFNDNMKKRNKPVVRRSKKNFTEIKYKPDFKQFGMENIDDDHFQMIKKRVFDIAGCNTDVKIYFNDVLIDFKTFKDYVALYTDDYIFEANKEKTWSIGISLSENGFQQVSFANSTETYDGGTHVDYVMNQIISKMREHFKKKHKVDVKPSELKNHMFLFLDSEIINPSFSSQSKEKLITETKNFGNEFIISDGFVKKIINSEITESILDWIEQKKKADERKFERQLNKNISKVKVDKLIDSKGKKNRMEHTLSIFEGLSAAGSFRKYRDAQTMGAFSLRGKILNATKTSKDKMFKNAEIVNLMASLGLKIGQPISEKTTRYGKILLYVDADTDGNAIASLLFNFFYVYWPELFDKEMIYKVETPIVVAKERNKKNKLFFYNQSDYNDWYNKSDVKKYDIKYKKGLAALVDDEYKDIINDPKITLIKKDDLAGETLNIWFGEKKDLRKKEIQKKYL